MKDELQEMHSEMQEMTYGIEGMRKDLEIMKKQNDRLRVGSPNYFFQSFHYINKEIKRQVKISYLFTGISIVNRCLEEKNYTPRRKYSTRVDTRLSKCGKTNIFPNQYFSQYVGLHKFNS